MNHNKLLILITVFSVLLYTRITQLDSFLIIFFIHHLTDFDSNTAAPKTVKSTSLI